MLVTIAACNASEPVPIAPPSRVEVPAAAVAENQTPTQKRLEAAIRSGMLHEQVAAVELLARLRIPKTASLLYLALDASPNVRVLAAHGLVDMRLAEAIPKLRVALAKSKERDLELEVGMALYRLGDRAPDIRAIVNSGTLPNHGMWRLEAALALADAGDDLGRPALADIAATTPKDGERYWRALGGLAKLGDPAALGVLRAELTHAQVSRQLRAAKLLAHTGDKPALDRLAKFVADKTFQTPEEVALVLANEGDRRALDWVKKGLASSDAEERLQAIALATWFVAAEYKPAIAKLSTDDKDETVRATAELAVTAL